MGALAAEYRWRLGALSLAQQSWNLGLSSHGDMVSLSVFLTACRSLAVGHTITHEHSRRHTKTPFLSPCMVYSQSSDFCTLFSALGTGAHLFVDPAAQKCQVMMGNSGTVSGRVNAAAPLHKSRGMPSWMKMSSWSRVVLFMPPPSLCLARCPPLPAPNAPVSLSLYPIPHPA